MAGKRVYGLSEKGLRELKDIRRRVHGGRSRRRPPNKRRRWPGGGGTATIRGAVAMIKVTVPAASAIVTDSGSEEITPGIKASDKIAGEGALLMMWNEEGTKYVADIDVGDEGWVDAVNLTLTEYRADSTETLVVAGTYQKIGTLERFVINDKDNRSNPGHSTSSTTAQIVRHKPNEPNYGVGGEEC